MDEVAVGVALALALLVLFVRLATWPAAVTILEAERDGEGMISERTGLWLKTLKWLPDDYEDGGVKGVVFCAHGFGGYFSPHRGLTAAIERLSREGFACFGLELQGHGRSEGIRCHVTSFDHYVDDFLQFVQEVMTQAPFSGQPCFILGQSMGGALAIQCNLRWEGAFSGLVLISPMCAIQPAMIPSWPIVQLLKVAALVFPTWAVIGNGGTITDKSTKDQAIKKKAMADPLEDHQPTRLSHGLVLLNTSDAVQKSAVHVTTPILICHGGEDQVTSPEQSEMFIENIGSSDKTLKIYDGMWHNVFDEPAPVGGGSGKVADDISAWLVARAARER